MIGILVIAHESFGIACELISDHVFNCGHKHVRYLRVSKEDDPEEMVAKAKILRDEVNFDHGVLVLNDIFGATPFNVAKKLVNKDTLLLTGANYPMLIRAITYASKFENAHELLVSAKDAAVEGIIDITLDNLKNYD